MSTAMSLYDPMQLPATQTGSDADYAKDARSGPIGRLKLYTKGKPIDRGQIAPGHYGVQLSKDEIQDLGVSVDVIPFARKKFAIDMSDTNNIVKSFDPTSEVYRAIEAASEGKESNCQHGTILLVYERSLGQWLEFFCGTKSTRPEVDKMAAYLPLTPADIERKRADNQDVSDLQPHGPLAMTLKVRLVETPSFSWHVPVAHRCSTPFVNAPDFETVKAEMTKFLAVKPVAAAGGRAR